MSSIYVISITFLWLNANVENPIFNAQTTHIEFDLVFFTLFQIQYQSRLLKKDKKWKGNGI